MLVQFVWIDFFLLISTYLKKVQTNPYVVGTYKILNLKEKECVTIWQVNKISFIKNV